MMACPIYVFNVQDLNHGRNEKFEIQPQTSIGQLRKLLAQSFDSKAEKIMWKLGTSFEDEAEECLDGVHGEISLQEFVEGRLILDPESKLNSCGDENNQVHFYLVVRPKHQDADSESSKNKYGFQPSWLFPDVNETSEPSASSSLEANAGTAVAGSTAADEPFHFKFRNQSDRVEPSSKIDLDPYEPTLRYARCGSDSTQVMPGFHSPSNQQPYEDLPCQPMHGPFPASYYASAEPKNCLPSTSYVSPMKREGDDVYVGLVNQAMTCYLNSLLQTLFMTPEFRNALYNWEYTGTKEEQGRSIPYHLQKLFILLQTSVGEKTALETKELTKSFGWDSSHAWDQHDVQELCRVMFDALEMKWRRTNQATVITALYQGTMKDYVKCLECSNENARNDVFLDLPLAIKPFGSSQTYRSVEEALRGFVQPEVLDGTNKYFCEKCQQKVSAHKGLKITKFPYLLTIQLKRFDFDYTTMHRIKLNDRMTFPDVLNLNPFVEVQQSSSSSQEAPSDSVDQNVNAPGGSGDTDAFTTVPACNSIDLVDEDLDKGKMRVEQDKIADASAAADGESDDEGICVDGAIGGGNSSAGSPIDVDEENEVGAHYDPALVNPSVNRCVLQRYLKEGPYVYELFSIMVHSGSANGGHYYAYIKNMDSKVWYCFNDQVVTRASIEDIRKTYGGTSSSPFMYSSYGSSTNAYMLMYRQIDPERNAKLPINNKLPAHILQMIDKLRIEEEEQRRLEERQRSMLNIRVSFYVPGDGSLLEKELEIQKRDPVSTLLSRAYETFRLWELYNIPIELCRLVRFSKSRELLDVSLDNNKLVQQELVWSYYNPELLLETAPRPGWFRPYTNGGLTLKIFVVDVNAGRVRLPKYLMQVKKTTTVQELQELIAELLDCDAKGMRLALDHFRSLRLLDALQKTMLEEDVYAQGTMFVECGNAACETDSVTMSPEEFEKTPFYAIIDQYKNTLRFHVTLPSVNEYNSLGFVAPYKSNSMPSINQEIEEAQMRSAHGSPCMPEPNLSSGIGISMGDARGTRPLLGVHQHEDCSTASGSTQYVTPATSRSPTPDRLDSTISAVSRDDPTSIDFEGQDLEVSVSGAATPSPRVSPDSSPISIELDTVVDRIAASPRPSFEQRWPLMRWSPVDPYQAGSNIPNAPSHYESSQQSAGLNVQPFSFDSDLSKIDVDAADENPVVLENIGSVTKDGASTPTEEKVDYLFEVIALQPATDPLKGPALVVDADRRMVLIDFIQKLAPLVGVSPDQLKLYKTFISNEYECTSLTSTLDNLSSASGLRVKLGRRLKEGESLVRILRFEMNNLEACGKHLFDVALMSSSKLDNVRHECQLLLKQHCGLDIPLDKIRLRDSGNGFLNILHDGSLLQERYSFWGSDLHLQILEEPETATTKNQTAVFLRRWCPSTLSLGAIQEFILQAIDPEALNQQSSFRNLEEQLFVKISRLSGIPLSRLQCVFATNSDGSFPYECGILKLLEETCFYGPPRELLDEPRNSSSSSTGCDVNSEGDATKGADVGCDNEANTWCFPKPRATSLGTEFNLVGRSNLPHDGTLIYYRDAQEKPKVLNVDERKELQIRDNAKLRKNQGSYSWRKERALKIYTEISSSLTDDLD